jgi:hypothetical protein
MDNTENRGVTFSGKSVNHKDTKCMSMSKQLAHVFVYTCTHMVGKLHFFKCAYHVIHVHEPGNTNHGTVTSPSTKKQMLNASKPSPNSAPSAGMPPQYVFMPLMLSSANALSEHE